MAENTQNLELRKCNTTRRKEYYYVPGRLSSINEISSLLTDNNDGLNERGRRMLGSLGKVKSHHFQHMQVPIPVYNVRHCTEKKALYGICREEGFRITQFEKTPEFRDLSYWGADISSGDLEVARQQAFEKVSGVIDPLHATEFAGELREQFGNSSAFKESASFFGNFKFSFPLSYLLNQYKDQHCGGREPQLRIFGTGLYNLEIAHFVVVHSPDTDKFNDFPEVPTVQGSSDVYWKDGTLYWRPESTSISLKVRISEAGSVCKDCYQLCPYFNRDGTCFHTAKGTYSVWNYMTLAFHLPNGPLKIPKEKLLKNLTACDADKVYLETERLSREEAEKIVQELKEGDEKSTSSS